MATSSPSMASARRLLSKVMVTSARPRLRREVEPLKITSAISPPRRLLALCSPRVQRTASTTLLLPEPFGPTIAVIPAGKSNCVLSAKLLKPTSSRRLSIRSPDNGRDETRPACLGYQRSQLGGRRPLPPSHFERDRGFFQ